MYKLNNLPKNWRLTKHHEISQINPKLPNKSCGDDMLVSFIPMKAVEAGSGKFDLSEERKFETVKKGYTSFINGDVIFAKITPCMENGKVALLKKMKNGIGFGSTEFHVSRPVTSFDNQFLFFYLIQESFRKEAQKNMTGSAGQLRVPKNFFENISIPLPPLPEQHRIVAKIEELFSQLDSGINSLKKAQAQLKIYRQAVLKYAFEGKLTEEWRKQHHPEPAEKLLEQIRLERERHHQQQLEEWKAACEQANAEGKKKPTKPRKPKELPPLTEDELGELPALPEGWCWVKVGNITLRVEYGSSAKSKEEGKIPVLRMGNIQNCIFDWSNLVYSDNDDEIKKYLLRNNDVLFNRTNSPELVGKTAIYQEERPAIFAGYLIRVNQIPELINAKYLNYFLNSNVAKNHGNSVKTDGVNQSNINGEKLNNYPLPYTQLSEQHAIVQEIESRLSVCDKLEQTIETNLRKSDALRQSILKKAFEGKLVPQNPDDEPAEKLLERIQLEKAELDAKNKAAKAKKKKKRR